MAIVCYMVHKKTPGYCGDDEASFVFSIYVTTYKNPSMTRAYGLKCFYAAIAQLHCIGEKQSDIFCATRSKCFLLGTQFIDAIQHIY